jgi:hypothetical protein
LRSFAVKIPVSAFPVLFQLSQFQFSALAFALSPVFIRAHPCHPWLKLPISAFPVLFQLSALAIFAFGLQIRAHPRHPWLKSPFPPFRPPCFISAFAPASLRG